MSQPVRPRSRRPRVGYRLAAGVALVGLAATPLLAACGSGDQDGAGSASPGSATEGASGTLTVVASTNVWGSVVSAIAGPGVEVRSIITDPAADPHSYESTPADAAAIARADLVVDNGGGYDDFVQKIVDSDDDVKAKTVDAFTLKADPADDNEHVWFDPTAVKGVVGQVTDRLSALEPAQSAALHQRADAFAARVDAETAQLAGIGRAKPGSTVVSTEPIAHYLLGTAGVADVTPEPFVEAIENENDPSAAVLSGVTATVASRGVNALVFNPQTETPLTEGLRAQATGVGVPVVNVTETLPAGTDYLQWLDANRTDLARALGAPA